MLLQDLLDKADVEYRNGEGDERTLCCPFCPDGDDKFHLGLNVGNGAAHCFKCDWKSRGVVETARLLARAFDVPFTIRYVDAKKEEGEAAEKSEKPAPAARPSALPAEYEKFTSDSEDKIEKRIRGYLKSRGITASQIERHQIGFAGAGRYAWRAIFPVIGEDGRVYGCVSRSIDVRQKPKYLNTPGIKLLWNGQRTAKTVVVTEGVMDALAVERALLRRKDWIAVARLGSTLTVEQMRQLRRYERIVILPDRDAAGVKGASSMAELCAANHIQVEVAVPEVMDERDPGDMTEDEINDYIDTAQLWTNATYYRMRAAAVK